MGHLVIPVRSLALALMDAHLFPGCRGRLPGEFCEFLWSLPRQQLPLSPFAARVAFAFELQARNAAAISLSSLLSSASWARSNSVAN